MPTFNPVTSTQTFTGSNGDAIGANWTQLRHLAWGGTARIIGNALGGHFSVASAAGSATDQSHPSLYRWTGAGSFSNDQYASITLGNLTAGVLGKEFRAGVGVRLDANSDAATTGYLAYVCDDESSGRTVLIVKLAGAALDGTTLDSRRQTIGNGDVLTLGVTGSTLTVYKNGVATTSTVTDSAYTTGKPGVYLASDESGGSLGGPSVDDWVGGDVASAVTATVGSRALLLGVGS